MDEPSKNSIEPTRAPSTLLEWAYQLASFYTPQLYRSLMGFVSVDLLIFIAHITHIHSLLLFIAQWPVLTFLLLL